MNHTEYTAITVDETIAVGKRIGRALRGGETIELVSDLGGGKTTLVRGISQGFGVKDPVSSPSFTICNTYDRGDGKQINHFDFYRLDEPGIVKNELQEYMGNEDSVVVIEWGGIVHGVLPESKVEIKITTNENESRTINCRYPDNLGYLFSQAGDVSR